MVQDIRAKSLSNSRAVGEFSNEGEGSGCDPAGSALHSSCINSRKKGMGAVLKKSAVTAPGEDESPAALIPQWTAYTLRTVHPLGRSIPSVAFTSRALRFTPGSMEQKNNPPKLSNGKEVEIFIGWMILHLVTVSLTHNET